MLSKMITGVKMRILEVCLLAVLGCSLAEGGLVSKCELKDQLTKGIGELLQKAEKPKERSLETLVAKIVCHVELASGFNTSVVSQLTPGMEDPHGRRKRDTGYGGVFGLTEPVDPEDPLITIRPHTREQQHDRQPPLQTRPTPTTRPTPPNRSTAPTRPTPPTQPTPPNRSTAPTRPTRSKPLTSLPHLDEEVWTLYGLFQLSSHLVCSDGTTPSPNICGVDCNNLVDDDTRDDVTCVITIFNHLIENGFGSAHWKELRRMIRLIFQEECSNKDPSEYFAECS